MFRPVAFFIGLRYTRAKRRNHFISFISLTSMIGIALGVMVLITVLSVMNGFDQEIRHRVFGMANHITVTPVNGSITEWKSLRDQISENPKVAAIEPFVSGQGILINRSYKNFAEITGINSADEKKVSFLKDKMTQGSLDSLQPNQFGIILGEQLALNLGVWMGDKVSLLIPSAAVTPMGVMPRFKVFKVVGIFRIGNGFGFDSGYGFINMHDAQVLYGFGNAVSGLRIKVNDFYGAAKIADEIKQKLSSDTYQVTDWTEDYGQLFHSIALEKTMMFLILFMLIMIAAFNLVSTLVMVVTDKQSDIAILRTLGATPRTILFIFIVQGTIVGFVGTLLGLLSGIFLAYHVTQFSNALQSLLHVQWMSSSVYYLNYLPSQIDWSDVWHIALMAFLMSALATLYPAWRASRVQPAEALRYE